MGLEPQQQQPVYWEDLGSCRGESPDLFFPDQRDADYVYGITREICNQCPVMEQCREHALANRIPHGMWGGMTPPERKRENRRRKMRREGRLDDE